MLISWQDDLITFVLPFKCKHSWSSLQATSPFDSVPNTAYWIGFFNPVIPTQNFVQSVMLRVILGIHLLRILSIRNLVPILLFNFKSRGSNKGNPEKPIENRIWGVSKASRSNVSFRLAPARDFSLCPPNRELACRRHLVNTVDHLLIRGWNNGNHLI